MTRVYIERPGVLNADQVKIYMVEGEGRDTREVSIVSAEKGEYFIRKLNEDVPEVVKPMLVMGSRMWEELVKAVLVYAKDNNVNVDQSKLEGKLEGMEKVLSVKDAYLEDMRSLAFKALEIEKP